MRSLNAIRVPRDKLEHKNFNLCEIVPDSTGGFLLFLLRRHSGAVSRSRVSSRYVNSVPLILCKKLLQIFTLVTYPIKPGGMLRVLFVWTNLEESFKH